jgi:NAD-dependent SIR2 family protein deacetylase
MGEGSLHPRPEDRGIRDPPHSLCIKKKENIMMQFDCELPATTFILGAGFSKCAGLPSQSDFSKLLLSNDFSSQIDLIITEVIRDFLAGVFGWRDGNELPSLEDIFTCIDLSASTGHNLGFNSEPRVLRALRRMLIYRIFSILDQYYDSSDDIKKLLKAFCNSHNSYYRCNFIVLNWDIVLEKHLRLLYDFIEINYCTPCYDWHDPRSLQGYEGVPVCKMHGSSNWVYCDNCKSIFYDLDAKLSLHLRAGLEKSDFDIFRQIKSDAANENLPDESRCKLCGNKVSTHIATFSYRKSFRTSAYSSIWYHAERLLANSDHWVFIGYSLPEADYEFKHLLKSAQLRKQCSETSNKRRIEVVIKNDSDTCKKFKKFFGYNMIHKCYNNGLSDYVSRLNPAIQE